MCIRDRSIAGIRHVDSWGAFGKSIAGIRHVDSWDAALPMSAYEMRVSEHWSNNDFYVISQL